ncbi:MAG: hypothetical protein A2527_09455 [Candidatus Lambdaproteobacteria bacterium RIFOXYD2_FULL_50_16]|uniref:Reactive intermediate/imine deaminase n=1 Tax=Candidatus Lambdaproteobacteria bacterium RIFOXYD2_FULL_50_16 TaxID=1817772 RepID=A0A1F6G7J3_9PROT|nr:MAG: hypothetical protein A2527_09455 [Candidatus Lambdaproteobacteria bacterium RIFOXYD2_FULL_50_16]
MIKVIQAEGAPLARGPYSHAIEAGGFLYTAGQIPIDPATGKLVGPDIHDQVRQVMTNLKGVLASAGANFNQVVKATVYLGDMGDFAAMNTIYAEFMGEHKPARACVEVHRLPLDCLVEIDLVAYLGA